MSKGYRCALSGKKYEQKVHAILRNTCYNNRPFNTQKDSDLGCSSAGNDIECNFKSLCDIAIELKMWRTPDWMQCGIRFDKDKNQWITTGKGRIPEECRQIFRKYINGINLYGGNIPPFLERQIGYDEWIEIKTKSNNIWKDHYIDIADTTIAEMYNIKGCSYIQVSGYGLYHTGKDICDFGVPKFQIPQQIRIRTKLHRRETKNGYCDLSVMCACQPKDIRRLKHSPFSLDNIYRLPSQLVYQT